MTRDEAIKELRGFIGQLTEGCQEAIKVLIPELAESEDERIRKDIISLVNEWWDRTGTAHPEFSTRGEMLAYLKKQKEPSDKGEISDGYHTFNELYYYRLLYNAAFFNLLPKEWVHKSKKHHDGEKCFGGGWFIVMAQLPTGQISNHYELKDWDLFHIPDKEVADEWDGHTPQEAAERLHEYLLEKQKEQKPAEKQDYSGLNGLERAIHRGFLSAGVENAPVTIIKETAQECLAQPKQEWSEEDSSITEELYEYFSYLQLTSDKEFSPSLSIDKILSWLKSLKNIGNFPKSNTNSLSWSEEDDAHLKWLCRIIHSQVVNKKLSLAEESELGNWMDKWLNHKPQSHWKPSEEQMRQLGYVAEQNKHNMLGKELMTLYNDLKKLM